MSGGVAEVSGAIPSPRADRQLQKIETAQGKLRAVFLWALRQSVGWAHAVRAHALNAILTA